MSEKIEILKKIDVVGTLRQMAKGQTAKFRAREFAGYSSVASAVSRLNKEGENFTLATPDNGETYTVTRA